MGRRARRAACPECGHWSRRLHSRRWRTVLDAPVGSRSVRLRLLVRRFFCMEPACPRVTFTEPFPYLVGRYARRTARLERLLARLALAMSAEAASRIARALEIPVSPDTLVRLVMRIPLPPVPPVRVLAVDDWAWRKGHRYGTILCDLERRRPVDLLPDRSPETLAAWLRAHPGVQIVVRDRSEGYAQGIRQGAPDAVQVADRWHLLKNLGEVLERYFQTLRLPSMEAAPSPPAAPVVPGSTLAATPQAALRRRALEQAARQQRRRERYDQVRTLHAQGLGIREISRRLHLSRATVRRYLTSATVPGTGPRRRRPSQLDPYRSYILQRWEQGCRNARAIYRELRAMGYLGGRSQVAAVVTALRRSAGGSEEAPPAIRPVTPRQLGRWFWQAPNRRSQAERAYLTSLAETDAHFAKVWLLAEEFAQMARQRRADTLAAWIDTVKRERVRPLMGFAHRLEQDFQAVYEAWRLPWSNGPTEGWIHKLKTIKRMMYGRAGLDLLRHRLLCCI
ncbi:MAG TPA: ISL3 family transposase [Limnochordales bacterium]